MRKTALSLVFLLIAIQATAQGYRGRDFWLAFPQNAILEGNKYLSLSIFICADSRSDVTITTPLDSSRQHLLIEAGASVEVPLDSAFEMRSSGIVEKKSVHVTSDHDISVYVVSHRASSTDSYMAIPTPLLGSEYVVVGYTPLINGPESFGTQATIVATQNNSLVTIKLSAETRDAMPRGRTITIPMNAGESFQIQSLIGDGYKEDLTGTRVTSTKPIAFFTGHTCAQVPSDISFCDVLIEEEPPANDWGREFVLTKFEGKDKYVVRVVGLEDSTLITGTHLTAKLNAGEYTELQETEDEAIHSSKPVLVAQYATSSQVDSSRVNGRAMWNPVGDPFLLIAIPNDRFIPEVTMTSVVGGSFNHYINIVVPDSGVSSLELDGVLVANKTYPTFVSFVSEEHLGANKMWVYTFKLASGQHTVHCKAPIAVYSYGFGVGSDNFDSYGHACGMRLTP